MVQSSDRALTERAREMHDFVSTRAELNEREGRVSEDIVLELKRAGMFRAFQSRRFGGLECHPADFFGAIIELAQACPSTGWILGIMGIHQFELANLSLKLQEEVLGADPDALVSSSYAPQGRVRRVEGGFVLEGQWKSSSGVDHASWVVLGGIEQAAEPDSAVARIFYVPLSDATVVDDWKVMGLSGTGSESVVLREVFVPDYRTGLRGGFQGNDGTAVRINDSPLYRLPQSLMYLLPGAAPVLGAAKGAYRTFIDQLKSRRPRLDGKMATEDPLIQTRVARAKILIDVAEERLMRGVTEMTATVMDGREIASADFARYFWDFCRPAEQCVEAAGLLFETLGASAVYLSNPLQRFYRDILTMRQHGTQDPNRGALAVARAELGMP